GGGDCGWQRLLLWWLEVVKIWKMMVVDGGAWWRCRLGVAAGVWWLRLHGVEGGKLGDGEQFWGSPEILPEKFSGSVGWPEVVVVAGGKGGGGGE
nr:hypothetical protein [Tanacetum cinerariifolium]